MAKLEQPKEAILYNFYPSQDFYEVSLLSQYITGERYSVREGNTVLDALVTQWVSEGRVTL